MLCIYKIFERVVEQMPTLLINLLYLFISVLTLLVIVINFSFFTKPNKKYLFFYTLILYIITIYLYSFNINNLFTNILFVSIFIYLLIIYKKLFISILLTVFISVFVFLCDSIMGFLYIFFLNYDYTKYIGNPLLHLITGIIFLLFSHIASKLTRIIILKLFQKIDFNYLVSQSFRKSFILVLIVLILLFVFYIYFLNKYIRTLDKYVSFNYILSSTLFFLSAICLIYYYLSTIIKNYKLNEFNQLKNYTTMIENMYTDLRSFKHDYLNILSTIETYLQIQDLNGLKNYFYNDLLPDSNKILKKDLSLSKLSFIKLTPLKALLSSKIIMAQSKGINIKIEISDNINKLNISIVDICRIIGILIDNAIDGSVLCENKFINLAIIDTDAAVIFYIANSCLSSTPPIYKLYKKNFSTKGENRGLGLKTIRKIIDDNYTNILLNTSIENCLFKQELIIKHN